ncbi:MAG: VOC family protein [Acidobacteria bacterium]|nr:VOC family protein [Acidobacteriota bacterium]
MGSTALSWAANGTFHHVGFVVSSIPKAAPGFAESLDAEWDGAIVHDMHQTVRVTFLRSRQLGNPLFELVEPAGEQSPVMSLAKRGGGLHHVCYMADALEKKLADCRARHCLIVRPPLPAAAFGGRRIAWVYTPNKLLIEYLER